MWNWDDSHNPWNKWGKKQCDSKKHGHNHCEDDPFDNCEEDFCDDDDNSCGKKKHEDNYDCSPDCGHYDSELLYKIIKALCILKKEIDKCEDILRNPKFGLKEIKLEVRNIERAVFSPTFGLKEIKSEVSEILDIVSDIDVEIPITLLNDIKFEVSAIESAVFNPTFGLEEIKSEVSTIETIVGGIQDMIDNSTFGLEEIKSEVSTILAIVNDIVVNPVFGISEIKAEVSAIESAVFNPTFGLEEIKFEVSEILSIVTNLNIDIEIPITLLNDIKSEVSAIESAVFSPTFGLEEIKSEVSQILTNQGVSLFLTSGPFLVECEEENLILKALNNTAVPQSVTFVIRGFGVPSPPVITTVLGPIAPCTAEDVVIDLATPGVSPGNLEIRALRSSTDVQVYAVTTSCAGRKITEFKASDFLSVATFCVPVI